MCHVLDNMSKLKLVFILSLVVLAGVFIATLVFVPSGQSYPESRRVQIIDADNEWILQYDIINIGEKDAKYNISITIDSKVYTDSTVVKQGKTYTYIHHIYPHQLVKGKVSFVLYEEGKSEPVEQATYYIGLD